MGAAPFGAAPTFNLEVGRRRSGLGSLGADGVEVDVVGGSAVAPHRPSNRDRRRGRPTLSWFDDGGASHTRPSADPGGPRRFSTLGSTFRIALVGAIDQLLLHPPPGNLK